MRKLKREVERAKCELSSQMVTKIEIEGFHLGNTLSETLTRARFVRITDCRLSFPRAYFSAGKAQRPSLQKDTQNGEESIKRG